MTSIENPASQSNPPRNRKKSASVCFSDVIAVKPAAKVMKTHVPPSVQVNKNLTNIVFITVKRRSKPAFFTRIKRKLPSLKAQTQTIAATITPLKSRLGLRATAMNIATRYDIDPIRSK
jgi:hypothetical protein